MLRRAKRILRIACPHCGARTASAHFCAECERVLPVQAGTDYFAFFGLPRRLRLDEAELEKSFYALSRQLHPDYFMSASAAERQASMERSSCSTMLIARCAIP